MDESKERYETTPAKVKKVATNFTPINSHKPPHRNLKLIAYKDTEIANKKTNINIIKVSEYSPNAAQFIKRKSTRNCTVLNSQCKSATLHEIQVEEQKSNSSSDETDECYIVKEVACKSTKNIAVSKKKTLGINIPLFKCKVKPLFKDKSDLNTLSSMNSFPVASNELESVSDNKLQNKEYIIYLQLELH